MVYTLGQHPIDSVRPFRIIVIGAGVSGIYAGIRIPQSLRNVDLTIYEKNADFGGTWFENRYAGCACDIPAHCYQYSFEPNPRWSSFYAPAAEICAYWKGVAHKYDVPRYTRFQHEVASAVFNEEDGVWDLQVRNLTNGQLYSDRANVVLQAVGSLNDWKWPDQPGFRDFGGHLAHSAQWDETYDYTGKRVALIGIGSSSIQILPNIQPFVKSIDQYARSPTWIGFPFLGDQISARDAQASNFEYTPEEVATFERNPAAYFEYRKSLMQALNGIHSVTMKDSELQAHATAAFWANMQAKLEKKPHIAQFIKPDFPAGCRRLTPGPGYLEALVKDNVDFVSDHIDHFDIRGIVTKDGTLREYDAIICATGFNTKFQPRFPLIGKNGVSLSAKWAEFPTSYCSVAVDDFPNYFIANGPNSGVGSGDLVILFQAEVDYAIQCMAKLQQHRYKSMEVTKAAIDDFQEYARTYFEKTVFGTECSSWYKGGRSTGLVSGVWPGSSLHGVKTLSAPRWEDFHFEYQEGSVNRFSWLGDGWTEAERDPLGDVAWYIAKPITTVTSPISVMDLYTPDASADVAEVQSRL